MTVMFAASAGAAFGAAAAPPAEETGGGGGGAYAARGASFGPRQMRIRCRDSRRSISLRSCCFISSTRRLMRSVSKTVSALTSGSLIGGFRGGVRGGGGGSGFLPACRRERDLSGSAIGKETGVRG